MFASVVAKKDIGPDTAPIAAAAAVAEAEEDDQDQDLVRDHVPDRDLTLVLEEDPIADREADLEAPQNRDPDLVRAHLQEAEAEAGVQTTREKEAPVQAQSDR